MKNQWNNRVVHDHLGNLNVGSNYVIMDIRTLIMVQTQVHIDTYMNYRLQICKTSNSITNNSSNLRVYKYLGKCSVTMIFTKT